MLSPRGVCGRIPHLRRFCRAHHGLFDAHVYIPHIIPFLRHLRRLRSSPTAHQAGIDLLSSIVHQPVQAAQSSSISGAGVCHILLPPHAKKIIQSSILSFPPRQFRRELSNQLSSFHSPFYMFYTFYTATIISCI